MISLAGDHRRENCMGRKCVLRLERFRLGPVDSEEGLRRSRAHGYESGEQCELLPIITTAAVALRGGRPGAV